MSGEWNDGRVEYRTARRFSTPNLHHAHTPILRSSAGFSLLEVLVALAIFGIAAGGVLVALGNHLKNATYLQDHARAVRIASREMNALRRNASLEDETEGADGRFSWMAQVMTDGLDAWPGIENTDRTPVLLNVTVQWSDSAGGPVAGQVKLDGFDVF